MNPEALTVAKLKVELEKLGQPIDGLKAVLVARLKAALAGAEGAPETAAPAKAPAQKKEKAVKSPDPPAPKPAPSPAPAKGKKKAAEVLASKVHALPLYSRRCPPTRPFTVNAQTRPPRIEICILLGREIFCPVSLPQMNRRFPKKTHPAPHSPSRVFA